MKCTDAELKHQIDILCNTQNCREINKNAMRKEIYLISSSKIITLGTDLLMALKYKLCPVPTTEDHMPEN